MYFNDRLGRKLSIMFSAIPSVVGYFFLAGAHKIWMLLVGRLLTGFAGGVTSAAIPVYISEISHPGIRGALGSCPQVMAVLGALFLYALGLLVPWRWLAVAGEIPVLLMVSLLFFMPDSPRFLISKKKEEEALYALQWLRGKDVDFWWEYEQIKASVQEQSQPISWTEIWKPYIVKPIVITLLMRFLQQLSGVTPILVYLQLIFDSTEVILAPQYDAVIVGAVRLASVLVAAFSMDKAGRKILLYVSACIMLASNLMLGFYIRFIPRLSHNCSAVVNGTHESLANSSMVGLTVIPLIATMFFIIGYAMGWGPITWLLMAEVLPLKARGVVSGLCVLVSWLTAFALTKAFLLVKEKYGLEVPFFFFSIICMVNLVFTYLLPETKGKSLERIESYFRTGRRSFLESFHHHRKNQPWQTDDCLVTVMPPTAFLPTTHWGGEANGGRVYQYTNDPSFKQRHYMQMAVLMDKEPKKKVFTSSTGDWTLPSQRAPDMYRPISNPVWFFQDIRIQGGHCFLLQDTAKHSNQPRNTGGEKCPLLTLKFGLLSQFQTNPGTRWWLWASEVFLES